MKPDDRINDIIAILTLRNWKVETESQSEFELHRNLKIELLGQLKHLYNKLNYRTQDTKWLPDTRRCPLQIRRPNLTAAMMEHFLDIKIDSCYHYIHKIESIIHFIDAQLTAQERIGPAEDPEIRNPVQPSHPANRKERTEELQESRSLGPESRASPFRTPQDLEILSFVPIARLLARHVRLKNCDCADLTLDASRQAASKRWHSRPSSTLQSRQIRSQQC